MVFPGYSSFATPIDWLVSMSEIILKGTSNRIKNKIKNKTVLQRRTIDQIGCILDGIQISALSILHKNVCCGYY